MSPSPSPQAGNHQQGLAQGGRQTPRDRVQALETDGYAIVDELAAPEVMDAISQEMAPFIEKSAFGYDNYLGKKTKRTGALIGRSPSSHQLITHPLVLGACKGVMRKAMNLPPMLDQVSREIPASFADRLAGTAGRRMKLSRRFAADELWGRTSL